MSETSTESLIQDLFRNRLNMECMLQQALRIGKRHDSQKRRILVKMNSVSDKIMVLKAVEKLNGFNIYICEDLSVDERKRRKMMIVEMNKARNDGKMAYIRFSDGNLIVDGSVVEAPPLVLPLTIPNSTFAKVAKIVMILHCQYLYGTLMVYKEISF